ncbi:hypothetical protein Tco_0391000 [Tanacetum coccineum]
MEELRIAFQAWSDNIRQKKEQEDKRIAEDQVAKARYWKIPICDDDDEEYTIAITPVLPTEKPGNSLSIGDEHLSNIPETESDELIKSSVENLVPIPSESEDECECDVPDCDDSQTTNFSTFSNPLFDDSTSSDDESSHEEDCPDFEVSRARSFCPSITRASNPQLHYGNPISKSYRLTFIFKHTY